MTDWKPHWARAIEEFSRLPDTLLDESGARQTEDLWSDGTRTLIGKHRRNFQRIAHYMRAWVLGVKLPEKPKGYWNRAACLTAKVIRWRLHLFVDGFDFVATTLSTEDSTPLMLGIYHDLFVMQAEPPSQLKTVLSGALLFDFLALVVLWQDTGVFAHVGVPEVAVPAALIGKKAIIKCMRNPSTQPNPFPAMPEDKELPLLLIMQMNREIKFLADTNSAIGAIFQEFQAAEKRGRTALDRDKTQQFGRLENGGLKTTGSGKTVNKPGLRLGQKIDTEDRKY
jgi:hypothetical protein